MNKFISKYKSTLSRLKDRRFNHFLLKECHIVEDSMRCNNFAMSFSGLKNKSFYLYIENNWRETTILPSVGMLNFELNTYSKNILLENLSDDISVTNEIDYVRNYPCTYRPKLKSYHVSKILLNTYHENRRIKEIDPDLTSEYLNEVGYNGDLNTFINLEMLESITIVFSSGERLNIISDEVFMQVEFSPVHPVEVAGNFLYINVNGYNKEIISQEI